MSQKKAVVVSASVYRGTGVLLRVDHILTINSQETLDSALLTIV